MIDAQVPSVAFATGSALEKNTVRTSQEHGGELHGVLMLIRLEGVLSEDAREKIRRGLEKTGSAAKSVEILKGHQKGIWNLFENTLAISWLRPAEDQDGRLRIVRDINVIAQMLEPLLQKHAATADNGVDWFVHEGLITGGEQARDSWRTLFAETLLRWKESKKGKT